MSKAPAKIHYYNPVKNWRKIKPHLADAALNDILAKDFEEYLCVHGQRPDRERPFNPGELPGDYESRYWRHGGRGGVRPAYRDYTKHSACHWLVNFNLRLAKLVAPDRDWRIVTSKQHSTVWDGRDTLFDLNFYAFGIPPQEAFEAAGTGGEELRPGELLRVYAAETHVSVMAAGTEIEIAFLQEELNGKTFMPRRVMRKTLRGAYREARQLARERGTDRIWNIDRWARPEELRA